MSDLTVVVKDEAVLAMIGGLGRQAPFIASRILNNLSKPVRLAEIEAMKGAFTVRRPSFLGYATRTVFATKALQEARVMIDPTRDRGILSRHGESFTKRPSSGRNLAIPVGARPRKDALVPQRLRLGNLGTFGKGNGKGVFKVGNLVMQRKRRQAPTLLYILKPSVPVRRRLSWVEVADRVVGQQFHAVATEAIDYALRTAR